MTHVSTSRGFTLIELMIAIAIFCIFMIIMAGVFARFVQTERHGISQSSLILDVQSAMDSFIKEARTGYGSTYAVASDGKSIAFRNQEGVCVGYRINPTTETFERSEHSGNLSGNCNVDDGSSGVFAPLTGEDTKIIEARFYPLPGSYDPATFTLKNQGVVTLALKAKSTKEKALTSEMSVQNTVTSRQVRAYDK